MADYNSPYTGSQLDETIRKITSNNIHTYHLVFENDSGAAKVYLSSLPAGPDGKRTGVYDIIYDGAGASGAGSVSRIYIHDENEDAGGSGHTDLAGTGNTASIWAPHAHYSHSDKSFAASVDTVALDTNAVTTDYGIKIYKITRQDTIA